jgi:hypothetical protein
VLPTGLPTGIVLREVDLVARATTLAREAVLATAAVALTLALPADTLFVSFGGIS